MQKVLIIVGPTASGKSALAVHLARRFHGEVISADSRQVYRGLDIGTGKISKREMKGVPHHLLDVASPKHVFTAGDFVRLARKEIDMIYHINRLPIIVGGTGFYIDALVGRVALPEVAPNAALRKRLRGKSASQLFLMLKRADPSRATSMNTPSERNNKVRLIRALEIAAAFDSIPMNDIVSRSYDALWLGIAPSIHALEGRISKRLAERLKRGMVGEAKKLHAAGLSYRRMEELGLEYRSLARHLQGRISKDEMIAEVSRDIRRYAKKQLAYWKRNKHIKWFKAGETEKAAREVRHWVRA